MCGIFGVVGDISEQLALECLNRLAHRGPDGSGMQREPGITLGHRRLAILDLSEKGKQPMSYAGGRYWITFNGEVYNFLELRQELEIKGHRFVSDSDTEVVLAAFAEWGESCLGRFNGMWAFAIWDSKKKSLFLARDRFGKKPLFYTFLPDGGFAFASEMKALFPLLGAIRPNVALVRDPNRIFQYEATEECVIEGLRRFPAGYHGLLEDGNLSVKRWWCTLDNLSVVPTRYEEQVENLRELFLDSCRLRMRSDVSIGTALSGGLDSSATISCMAFLGKHAEHRQGPSWQHAFVASFPGTHLDEAKYARQVTDHLGIGATILEIDPVKAIGQLERYLYLFEELYITSPIPFMLTYRAVKDHGISVTLDGHGADELFGGYSFDFLVALRDAGWDRRAAFQVLDAYRNSIPEGSTQLSKMPSHAAFWVAWKAKQFAKNLLGRDREPKSKDNLHPAWRGLDHLNQRLYISTHETILPTLLRNYDRYSMANGVEIRMPFMDHRLVSFAFGLPWTARLRNGFSKAIVRDAVAPYLPSSIAYRRTKIGFTSPTVDWIRGPLKELFQDTMASRPFRESSLIDPVATEQAVCHVMQHPEATLTQGERAWTLMMPYWWEQAVVKQRGAAA